MNTYDSLFNTICRVCLTQGKSENTTSLIDNMSADGLSCHGKAITTFADIFIRAEDNFPHVLCQNCLDLLNQAIRFKKKCKLSDRQLKLMKKLCDTSQDDFKESVCQYTMFKTYFPEEIKIKKSRNNHSINTKPKISSRVKITEETVLDSTEMFSNIDNDDSSVIFEDNLIHNELEQSTTLPAHNYRDSGDKLLDILEKTINADIKIRKQKYNEENDLYTNKHDNGSYEHRKIKKKQRNFVCAVCQKVLANAITYDHHMQRHNGCRYICDQCGKGFVTLAELNMHQVARHGNGQFYQCNHCSYKAPRKIDLIEHLRLHTGERPYTCEKCGLTFRRKAIWKKHLILHTEKNIQCSQCPRKFFTQSALADHMNNIHERRYAYVCSKCGVTYAKNKTVRDHLRLKHGIPREMQGKIERISKVYPI